jgi:hypothetical protein
MGTYKGLSTLTPITRDGHNFHTKLVQLVNDLLQAGQIILADGIVLASVDHHQQPLACWRSNLEVAPLSIPNSFSAT